MYQGIKNNNALNSNNAGNVTLKMLLERNCLKMRKLLQRVRGANASLVVFLF